MDLRRFDHSAIFVLIAATYTPFLQKGANDPLIFGMLIFVWAVAALGITLKCVFPGRYDRLAILLYLGMGWSGIVVVAPLSELLPSITLWLIVIGGVIYSLGVIFHVWERLRSRMPSGTASSSPPQWCIIMQCSCQPHARKRVSVLRTRPHHLISETKRLSFGTFHESCARHPRGHEADIPPSLHL